MSIVCLGKTRFQYVNEIPRTSEGHILFNDALNTFEHQIEGRKEMFYLTTHSTHFIYGYMASDIIW